MNERECENCANYKDTGEGYSACSKWECEYKRKDDAINEQWLKKIDDIKSEIAHIEYLSYPQPFVVLTDVLKIIDKHTKGEEE